jgi:uncharacterized protein YcbK (DUF882 family)
LLPSRLQSWYYFDLFAPQAASLLAPATRILALGFASVADFQISFAGSDLRTDGVVDADTLAALAWVASNDGRLSPHFRIAQFRSKATGQIVAHRELLRGLEALLEAVPRLSVIHGFRTPEDEERIKKQGGQPAKQSQHKFGTAADIALVDFSVVRALNRFSGIGCQDKVGGMVRHVDVRHAGAHNITNSTPDDPEIWIYERT